MANTPMEDRVPFAPPSHAIAARLVRIFGLRDAAGLARASVSDPQFGGDTEEEWRAIAAEIESIGRCCNGNAPE
jgi:hypothetical protein